MAAAAPKTVANGKFKITKKLAAGCFGEVHLGLDSQTKTKVAIKLENTRTSVSPQLKHEADILKEMSKPVKPQGFTDFFDFCKEGPYFCLVMEFLGKSLEGHLEDMKGKFTVKTTVLIADQILQRIEYLHSKGFVHRDIKSENFATGVGGKQHHVFLIDFGLSKKFWDKAHIEEKKHMSLTGTARYASINALKGKEQSRRDDLEAIGHMLIYFVRGSLPWSGLDAKTQTEKYEKIMRKKETTPIDELCTGMPQAFPDFLDEARKMGFKQRPDYERMRSSFVAVREELAQSQGPIEDWDFEWNDCNDTAALEVLRPVSGLRHPDDQPQKAAGKKGGFCCFGGSKTLD